MASARSRRRRRAGLASDDLSVMHVRPPWCDQALDASFHEPDIRDPSAFAAGKPSLDALPFEVSRGVLQHRLRDVVERIDADDRVCVIVDLAGDHRHTATASTEVEHRGACAKRVVRYPGRLADRDDQCGRRVGGPDATVLDTERAATRAGRDTDRPGLPIELEGKIAAMAATVNTHCRGRVCGVQPVGIHPRVIDGRIGWRAWGATEVQAARSAFNFATMTRYAATIRISSAEPSRGTPGLILT